MKTSSTAHTIRFGKRKIDVVLTRTERKRLRIIVEPDLIVRVVAPLNTSDQKVLKGVQEKAAWITRNLDQMRDYHPLPAPKQYISGESFTYLGRSYRLKVLITPRPSTASSRAACPTGRCAKLFWTRSPCREVEFTWFAPMVRL